jgi:hypothetical protein
VTARTAGRSLIIALRELSLIPPWVSSVRLRCSVGVRRARQLHNETCSADELLLDRTRPSCLVSQKEKFMASCGYCGTTILFGGVREGDQRFCNDKCHQFAYLQRAAQMVPANELEHHVEEVFRGTCPKCHGSGPVDVYKSHRVWSAMVLTSWSSSGQICCRSCGTKNQLGSVLFCLFLGWWGLPWGLIMTPVQITRNIAGMFGGESSRPSSALRNAVQVQLGAQLLQAGHQNEPQSGPPPLLGRS